MKEKDSLYLIIGALIIVVVIFGLRTSTNTSYVKETETIQLLNSQDTPNPTCSISLSPSVVVSGNVVTGTLYDGANTLCETYVNYESAGWTLAHSGMTDSSGYLTYSSAVVPVGTYLFRSICGSCLTNTATLIVQEPPSSSSSSSGSSSGGTTYTCTDGDGGINFEVSSYCEDSYHSLGFADKCDGNTAIEYYCDSTNICVYTSNACGVYETCVNGVCQQQPCSSIINPSSQAMCTQGRCDAGTCTFIPATITTPASCGCQ